VGDELVGERAGAGLQVQVGGGQAVHPGSSRWLDGRADCID
jgi:hypothetical protein